MEHDVLGTQHLTALAAPSELVDWRLALCFETAYTNGILDALPATVGDIATARGLDDESVRAVLYVLVAWNHVSVDEDDVFTEGPSLPSPLERSALAQHGTWIRRWAIGLPRRISDRRAAGLDTPATPEPAVGLALLEAASRTFVRDVVDTCRVAPGCRVLDLGGGHGAYAREFAARGGVATMQDLPGVAEVARADSRLVEAGVEVVGGDAFTWLAPGPFDLVFCGTFTNLFPPHQVRELLTRVRGVLAPGGQLVMATWLRDRGPVGAAFGVQMLVATSAGDAHGEADYRRLLAGTGYSDVRLVDVGNPALTVILASR